MSKYFDNSEDFTSYDLPSSGKNGKNFKQYNQDSPTEKNYKSKRDVDEDVRHKAEKNKFHVFETLPTWVFPVVLLALGVLVLLSLSFWYKNKNKTAKPDELTVTFAPKVNHPWLGQGSTQGFIVNGKEGGTISLKRNTPYKFIYASPGGAHPLYFTTSSTGGVGMNDAERIKNSPELDKEGSTIITFGKNYPDNFYYQSANDAKMGGPIKLLV